MDWLDQFVPGGILAAFLAAGYAAARYVPTAIFALLRRAFMTSLVVRDANLVHWLSAWIGRTDYGKDTKWLDATIIDAGADINYFAFPGMGTHSFVHGGRRYWLSMALEDNGMAGRRAVFSLSALGRDRSAIVEVLDEAIRIAKEMRVGKNTVYINESWGGWEAVRMFDGRPKDTIFLREGVVDEIIEDALAFWDEREEYIRRGIPHRRGHLFYGPPGNGKSSLVQAIATEAMVPIYALSLNDEKVNDRALVASVGRLPERSILLIEDIEKIDFDDTAASMAGLLNAIDGPLASDGRLLVLTANSLTNVNPILLRPGRIDMRWEIGAPDSFAFNQCLHRFSLDGSHDGLIASAQDQAWSMAQFQQHLILEERRLRAARHSPYRAEA